MTTANDFGKYYKTISNTELLSILENPGDYQASAIETAKKEFSDRQLSDTEIEEAKKPLDAKQLQKEKQAEIIKTIEEKIKSTGNTLIETLNPIQTGIPSAEKTIRFIIIVFSGLFLYEFIKDFRTHLAYVKDIPRFPTESILYLFPFLLLPLSIIIFWQRKSIGWVLLTIFVTFSFVAVLWLLIQVLLWKPSGNSDFEIILFPRPPLFTIIIQLIFFAGTLYALCKQNVRQVFSISENKMIMTTGITGVLTFFIVYTGS